MPVVVLTTCRSAEELVVTTAAFMAVGFVIWLLIMATLAVDMVRKAKKGKR